jgi:hypothetical protein
MQDTIFVYKKDNEFIVLSLDKTGHGNALSIRGWKHISTMSASAWLENFFNMTSEDRESELNELLDAEG